MAVYDDLLWNHATNPAVVDIVADLLGTDDIKMYGDQLFMKSPVTGTAQPWHQDSASWRDIFPDGPGDRLDRNRRRHPWTTAACASCPAPIAGACCAANASLTSSKTWRRKPGRRSPCRYAPAASASTTA